MFNRLHEFTVLHLPDEYMGRLFVLCILLSALFLVSRRMNTRMEAAAPASRLLQRLAGALSKRKSSPANQMLAWLLRKIDLLLYDKLKLLPDTDTGRRLNFFLMMFAAWLVLYGTRWIRSSGAMYPIDVLRYTDSTQALQVRSELFGAFFLVTLCTVLLPLPFFLVRKNREFYFDLIALFTLLCVAVMRLYCWRGGCCFGIPYSWGVFSQTLQATVFPVQLFEFICNVLGVAVCVLFMLRAKSYRQGRGCTFCMLWFTIPKFFFEFYRYHESTPAEKNGFFGLTMVQSVCVAGAALGVAWLFLLPLEKKLMDRFWLFFAGRLRKLRAKLAG